MSDRQLHAATCCCCTEKGQNQKGMARQAVYQSLSSMGCHLRQVTQLAEGSKVQATYVAYSINIWWLQMALILPLVSTCMHCNTCIAKLSNVSIRCALQAHACLQGSHSLLMPARGSRVNMPRPARCWVLDVSLPACIFKHCP